MITRIETTGYRCLKSVAVELNPFEILVGPNGSGKSAFLDVVALLGAIVSEGVDSAVSARTQNFYDLVWGRHDGRFDLAIEVRIPVGRRASISGQTADAMRYEIGLRIDPMTEAVEITKESVVMYASQNKAETITTILSRDGHSTQFGTPAGPWGTPFSLPATYASLGNLPMPESECSPIHWLRRFLKSGIRYVRLEVDQLRNPSPPKQGNPMEFNGSGLARLVAQLADKYPKAFDEWVRHLRTVLPDLDTVRTISRPEDKHRYLMLRFSNGIEVPSWITSEGTLRMLSLTFLAYDSSFEGVCLVEEPENGIHPTAVETVYQSLSSVYRGQVMAASHSPILINLAKPEELLCFSRTPDGSVIIRGSEHPLLRDWKSEVSLSDLFAAGVLS